METKNDCKKSLRFCFDSTRFLILIISTAALSFVMANSLALNFTIICMVKEPVGGEEEFLEQLNITDPEPLYTLGERSWLFSAIAIGNIIGTIPLTYALRFGVRRTFAFYGVVSGISTLLLPYFVSVSFALTFVARVLQGFGLTISVTSLGAIVSSWSALSGAGMFISVSCAPRHFKLKLHWIFSFYRCTFSLGQSWWCPFQVSLCGCIGEIPKINFQARCALRMRGGPRCFTFLAVSHFSSSPCFTSSTGMTRHFIHSWVPRNSKQSKVDGCWVRGSTHRFHIDASSQICPSSESLSRVLVDPSASRLW